MREEPRHFQSSQRKCDCDFCKLSKKVREIIEQKDVAKLIDLAHDLMNRNINIGEDLDRYKAIFDGSWPGAFEILKRKLNEVSAKDKKQNMKIKTELYGEKIGVDSNLRNLIEKKECKILLTITSNDDTTRHQYILGKDDATNLIKSLERTLNHQALIENGF